MEALIYTVMELRLIPICFHQNANWYGGGESAARKFLKNQALPVFQKLWRLAFKLV
jgi:ABC-type cobalt transport system substrate-binding protein